MMMKKQLFFIALCMCVSTFLNAQSVKFTSTAKLAAAQSGTTMTVNYKYTVLVDGNISCGINLLDKWTYVSNLVSLSNPVVAGTDVIGSFKLNIPKGAKLSSDLKGNLNYKIMIELRKKSGGDWLAGDYPSTPIEITSKINYLDPRVRGIK
jgi:hypothetical protein